jgi:AcrR family transcriptional regulator
MKLRDRLREVVRDEIVTAAEEEFAREGLHKARMETIASRAGVAVGTVYNHFKDRDALLGALLDDRRAEMCQRLDEAMAAVAAEGFRAELRAFFSALLQHFDAHRPFLSILIQNEHSGCQGRVTAFAGAPSKTMTEVGARAKALVQKGLEEEALRRDGAELFPSFLVGVVRSVLVHHILYSPEGGITGRAEAMARFFLEGAAR